jgi:hypothetical protein
MQHIQIPTTKAPLYGNVEALVTFTSTFADTTAVKKCTIRADAANPVYLEIQAEVTTIYVGANLATAVNIGTSVTATEFISGATGAALAFLPASNAVVKKRIVANTDIYVKASAAGTAGATLFYVQVTPIAPSPSNVLGALV